MRVICNERCYVCGQFSRFLINDEAVLLREASCEHCGASLRNSGVARIILCREKSSLSNRKNPLARLSILNTCSSGVIHNKLQNLPNYICSEYFDDIKNGTQKNGVYSVDLCNIPFSDNTFDLIISEDVLEHVDDYEKALREIWRTLKPGGRHIFTVPLHEGRQTCSRKHNEKIVYHGDPLRENGAFVVTDFGDDLEQVLKNLGFTVKVHRLNIFYQPNEITDVDATYDDYLKNINTMERYFKYNTVVYETKKTVLSYYWRSRTKRHQ